MGFVIVLALEEREVEASEGISEGYGGAKEQHEGGEVRKAKFVGEVGYVREKLDVKERDEVLKTCHRDRSRRKESLWFIAKQRDLYPPEEVAQFALFMPGLL